MTADIRHAVKVAAGSALFAASVIAAAAAGTPDGARAPVVAITAPDPALSGAADHLTRTP